jgi:cell division protein FtsB
LWYSTVDANEYKAAIQGHYAILETTDGELKRSLTASRHYNDYKIGDRAGNIDGRQGIKLGYGGVEVIDVFNKSRQGTTFQLEVTPSLVDKHSDDLEVTAMDTTQAVSQKVIESVSESLEALPEIEKKEQPEDSIVSKRRQPRRVKPIAVDLELLKTVAGRFDIEIRSGKGQGYDHALSELLLLLEQNATLAVSAKQRAPGDESPSTEFTAPVSQTVADQAKTLAWLTGRVEGLEAEITQLQQEKQKAIASSMSLENEQSQQEINQLHDENNRLKTELLQTQSRLEGIQRFLNGGAIEMTKPERGATAAITMTTPTDAIKTQPPAPTTLSSPQKVSVAGSPQADLDPDVLRALQAILDYNEYEATSHQQRWAISIPVLKDLLKQLGKATQPKIEAVLRAKSEVVNEHHRHYGLGQRHNRVHNGQSISDLIKL